MTSTYVTNTTTQASVQSGSGGMDDAMKRMLTRALVTSAGAMVYSMGVLGVPFSTAQVTNALALGGVSVSAEALSRYAMPALHITSSKSIVNYGIEAAIAGAMYATIYPRFVFPGSNVSMMTLARNAATVDVASSLVSSRVHDALFTDRGGY
jgi:hypothetical protein